MTPSALALACTLAWSAPAAGTPAAATAPTSTRSVPEDGRGSLVVGSLGLAAGVGAIAASSALLVYLPPDPGQQPTLHAGMFALSSVVLATGGLFTAIGSHRSRRYRSWRAEHGQAPQQGNGLLASGGVLMATGGLAAVISAGWIGGLYLALDGPLEPPLVTLGAGVLVIATGATLLSVGKQQRRRFYDWRDGLATARLSPILAPSPQGLQLGLAGQF